MDYDPLDPNVTRDPYPYYAWLRREAPVYRTRHGFMAVSRYEDVLEVLREPTRFSSSAMGDIVNQVKSMSGADLGGGETLIGTDPPAHTRLRKIVNRAFTPRRVAALEPRIRAVAGELIDELAAEPECDLMAALAVPLPVMMIAEILGIDAARFRDFKRWSEDQIAAMAGPLSPELRASLEKGGIEREAYLDEVFEDRRRNPRDDVISDLVQAEQEVDVMTADEVGNFVVLLMIAGNETTTNLIGNAVLALGSHPESLASVRRDPSLVPNALEETLRYDAPVQLTLRRATEDVELSGGEIPRDTLVAALIGSANRDERHFDVPDRFDVHREGPGHLSFGFGTHFCLGANLARLEARILLEALLYRFRRVEVLDSPEGIERVPSLMMRGARSLRVHLT